MEIENKFLTVVVPFYNEEEVVPLLRREFDHFFSAFPHSCEFVFVNDGSTDRTSELLDQWSQDNKDIVVIHLTENQGHQKSLIEGIRKASGRHIATMDADLQDPLAAITEMLDKSREGFEIVHTRRISREGESVFRRFSAWCFYRISKHIFQKTILVDVGDFRLMTRNAATVYFTLVKEPKTLRKEIPALPVTQTIIPYARKPRITGKSKFTIKKLIELAFS